MATLVAETDVMQTGQRTPQVSLEWPTEVVVVVLVVPVMAVALKAVRAEMAR
jgi:hypothetical protein